ncbi:MAG TPA: peptide ABC transporter substrate-binding protein, partial [Chloroflexi bacterium]|nr:peptide ABC transporter substrate-binding protein [Chloroflexota bacterium]
PMPTPPPTDIPTPMPPKELIICQAQEPETLFLYGQPSRGARNVLEAIYDGPIDTVSYQFQPVILEKIPRLSDGDVALQTISVGEGHQVATVDGLVIDLSAGALVYDAGGQPITYQGGVITMTQMIVTFTLRADVAWSDGQAITANDSRYSFDLASAFDRPALQRRLKYTQDYRAAAPHTIVWIGVPGYIDSLYPLNFYHPLPRHQWGGIAAEQLMNAEMAHFRPMGWGAFVVESWTVGERITLVRNTRYFRASEGLPHLDRVTFRFVPDLPQALERLKAGECDVIAQDLIEGADVTPLLEAAQAGVLQLVSAPSNEWEHLDFGIGQPDWVDRPPFFRDVRTRQAVARCVDRARVAQAVYPHAPAPVAHSYVANNHPLYAEGQLYRWDHTPGEGMALLEAVGWRDQDSDGIREAYGIPGIRDGTPFSVTLLTASGYPAREQTARLIAQDLSGCGIGVAVKALPPEAFFADGPEGKVFGRQFGLAIFSWMNDLHASCELYLSTEAPRPENWWAASNNPGYASADYDTACRSAMGTVLDMETHARFHHEAQRIFSHDLPVLPLYFVPQIVAARPAVQGIVLDPSQYWETWRIETFDLAR